MFDVRRESLLVGCFTLIGILIAFFLVGPLIFMLAWNFVMPVLFHAPLIGYWQSFALCVLLSWLRSSITVRK